MSVSLKKTGAVYSDFLTDFLKELFYSLLQIHQLAGLLLQCLLVFIIRLFQICEHIISLPFQSRQKKGTLSMRLESTFPSFFQNHPTLLLSQLIYIYKYKKIRLNKLISLCILIINVMCTFSSLVIFKSEPYFQMYCSDKYYIFEILLRNLI